MELRALRTLVAIVDARSFSVAADQLGYTQSAVSQQMASLERELGVELLSRRPVAATTAGAALVAQARELIARADAAVAQARRTAGAAVDARPPRVTVSPGAEPVLASLGAGGAAAWTALELRSAPEAVAALVQGRADLAIVDGVTAPNDPLPLDRPSGLVVDVLIERSVDVLLPASHPLAGRSAVDLDALDHARWIDAAAAAISTGALEAVARRPLRRGQEYDGSSPEMLAALVAAGSGLLAVPEGERPAPGVVAVRLRTPQLTHRVELWRHEHDRRPVAVAAARISGGPPASQ